MGSANAAAAQLTLPFGKLEYTKKRLRILVKDLGEGQMAYQIQVNRSGCFDPLINKRIKVPEFPASILRADVDKDDLVYNLRRINA